jgi:hypothetical protein
LTQNRGKTLTVKNNNLRLYQNGVRRGLVDCDGFACLGFRDGLCYLGVMGAMAALQEAGR